MDTFAEVLHHLVDNCAGFVAAEAQKAHALITDELGGDRHHSVPDPDDPEAGVQSDDNTDAPKPDSRDAEIARLRAELAERDSKPPAPSESPAPAVSAPDTATQVPTTTPAE